MKLRRSTRVWLILWVAATLAWIVIGRVAPDAGCLRIIALSVAWATGLVLLWRLSLAAFRLIVHRLTLRLAFSYFLIGIVPIPLLAVLLGAVGYLFAHQYMANRLRREITAIGEAAARTQAGLPTLRGDSAGTLVQSDVPWLRPGEKAPWLLGLERPGFLVSERDVWLVAPSGKGQAVVLRLTDPSASALQELADRTGYTVGVERGESAQKRGITIQTAPKKRDTETRVLTPEVRPRVRPSEGAGLIDGEWVHAFYLETALNARGENAETGQNVAVLAARTSPRVLFDQLFSQGVPEVGRIFWIVLLSVAGVLLLVYLVALAIAFVLVGGIARNINRLTRATQAIARGDFSVRVNSRSRDQIGDLARSFDGMAASIQRLLVETALKERLEGELAVARTIQHKLLPPPEARSSGFAVHAHFEPVAEIGGDYYDYLSVRGGKTAFALGDVSGHGLPVGLLVAMVKAALSTLLEAGHEGSELFGRLNELIYRSTDPRHYMTLVLLAYDPSTRRGVLTNAGQLAPYRVRSDGGVESLALPSFPLGLFPDKTFPACEFAFEGGDVVVFFTDGLIEAVDAAGEPFGFERFERVLRERSSEGAAAMREALLEAVRQHTGETTPVDDRTLMLVTLE